jgi:hypothetical protein
VRALFPCGKTRLAVNLLKPKGRSRSESPSPPCPSTSPFITAPATATNAPSRSARRSSGCGPRRIPARILSYSLKVTPKAFPELAAGSAVELPRPAGLPGERRGVLASRWMWWPRWRCSTPSTSFLEPEARAISLRLRRTLDHELAPFLKCARSHAEIRGLLHPGGERSCWR